jgi:hypothetical protein
MKILWDGQTDENLVTRILMDYVNERYNRLVLIYVLWRVAPLLGKDHEKEYALRCFVAAGKHGNNIRAIAKQPPITTIENCWRRCFLLGLPRGYIARTPGGLSEFSCRIFVGQ